MGKRGSDGKRADEVMGWGKKGLSRVLRTGDGEAECHHLEWADGQGFDEDLILS
jgi:hypothetical protein